MLIFLLCFLGGGRGLEGDPSLVEERESVSLFLCYSYVGRRVRKQFVFFSVDSWE